MTTPIPRPVLIFLAVCITMMVALLALRALEIQLPMLALWVFVLLSLTLGFGHGALDAVLLLEQFEPRSKAFGVSVAYFLCVLLAGWSCLGRCLGLCYFWWFCRFGILARCTAILCGRGYAWAVRV